MYTDDEPVHQTVVPPSPTLSHPSYCAPFCLLMCTMLSDFAGYPPFPFTQWSNMSSDQASRPNTQRNCQSPDPPGSSPIHPLSPSYVYPAYLLSPTRILPHTPTLPVQCWSCPSTPTQGPPPYTHSLRPMFILPIYSHPPGSSPIHLLSPSYVYPAYLLPPTRAPPHTLSTHGLSCLSTFTHQGPPPIHLLSPSYVYPAYLLPPTRAPPILSPPMVYPAYLLSPIRVPPHTLSQPMVYFGYSHPPESPNTPTFSPFNVYSAYLLSPTRVPHTFPPPVVYPAYLLSPTRVPPYTYSLSFQCLSCLSTLTQKPLPPYIYYLRQCLSCLSTLTQKAPAPKHLIPPPVFILPIYSHSKAPPPYTYSLHQCLSCLSTLTQKPLPPYTYFLRPVFILPTYSHTPGYFPIHPLSDLLHILLHTPTLPVQC